MKKNVVARPPKLTEDRRIKGRGVMATKFLWQLMAAARAQASPYTWIKEGGLDAEEFLECLESGRPHPLLDRWRDIKGTTAAGRPAPTARVNGFQDPRKAGVMGLLGAPVAMLA
jgi:hypothetical protein